MQAAIIANGACTAASLSRPAALLTSQVERQQRDVIIVIVPRSAVAATVHGASHGQCLLTGLEADTQATQV
jgi:hypothetical protein